MGNAQSDPCCQVREAAQRGERDECASLIREGASADCQDNMFKVSALHEACRFGHHDIVTLLLKTGCNVDARDCIGHTPLFNAAKNGFSAIVCSLIEHGADVNARSDKGKTPLLCAVENGHKVAMLLLAEAGADLNTRDAEGRSLAQIVARAGKLRCLVTCRIMLESSESSRALDEVIDMTDPDIPERARLVLTSWVRDARLGRRIVTPPLAVYNADDLTPLRKLLGHPELSALVREPEPREQSVAASVATSVQSSGSEENGGRGAAKRRGAENWAADMLAATKRRRRGGQCEENGEARGASASSPVPQCVGRVLSCDSISPI